MSYYQFETYKFTLWFQENSICRKWLISHEIWQKYFTYSSAFCCGLELQKHDSTKTKLVFVTDSKRTYSFDVLTKFNILSSYVQTITRSDENITLVTSDTVLYEDTELSSPYTFQKQDKIILTDGSYQYSCSSCYVMLISAIGFVLDYLYDKFKMDTLDDFLVRSVIEPFGWTKYIPQISVNSRYRKFFKKVFGIDIAHLTPSYTDRDIEFVELDLTKPLESSINIEGDIQ